MERTWKVPPIAWTLVLFLAGLKLLIHGLSLNSYGFFRDELYFLDCARHLQWGYVDDTPGIVMVFRLALMAGESLPVVRFLAALGGAGTVVMGSLVARELGGGRFAQGFAGLCVLAAPVFLGMDSILCVGVLEPLAWMGCVILLARLARTGDGRLWLAFGLVAGLGIEVKYTMLLVLGCLLAAMVITPLRKEFRRGAFWGGVLVAILVALPTLAWQVRHHYPLLVDMENIRRTGKNVVLGPWPFLKQQILILNPLLVPFWIAGLVSLFRNGALRVLAWFYLILLGAMLLLHAKDYYVAAIYPMLFAAGAVALERALDHADWSRDRILPRAALCIFVCANLLLIAPLVLPLLPPEGLMAYQRSLGVRPQRLEVNDEGPLDQRLGDQFGWKELVDETAAIYRALPEAERAGAGIYAGNYGEAGAINHFGPALGLPAAICAHQADSYWGLPAVEPSTFICLGCGRKGLEKRFQSVVVAGNHHNPWGMGEENGPIYVCRGLRTPLKTLWPEITHWN